MKYNINDHLASLTRHIKLVQEACQLLGFRIIKSGRLELAQDLIARGYRHDNSKFYGIEWDYLHVGKDVPKEKLDDAVTNHNRVNDHHPEFWGGLEYMPEICVAEMVCDWYARSQEFGTALRDWITNTAVSKYHIDLDGEQYQWIKKYVDILLENDFK